MNLSDVLLLLPKIGPLLMALYRFMHEPAFQEFVDKLAAVIETVLKSGKPLTLENVQVAMGEKPCDSAPIA